MSGMAVLIAGILITVSVVGGKHSRVASNSQTLGNSGQYPLAERDATAFILKAGESLLQMHEDNHGGWRFRSEIQAPHYQTDRDVGAASVGMGFLALADKYPQDSRWIAAAEKTATWLTAVSEQDNHGGRFWHDYVDDTETSPNVFTSFDDGAIGIGDFYWQLYEKTQKPEYKQIALQTAEWTFSKAENVGTSQSVYRWRWDLSDTSSSYQMGMGEGQVGLIHSFATFYERTKVSDPAFAARCKQYLDGAVRYVEQTRAALGRNGGDSRALPETGVIGQDGDTNMNSGYLSGAAGAAMMYLKLYQVFGDQHYLSEANQLFGWLSDSKSGPMVKVGNDAVAWKLALDPQGSDNTNYATGMEEGSAGIGWVYLQAYEVTGNTAYLDIAKKAANWLLMVAIDDAGNGLTWHEDEHPASKIVHPNLNNGGAGIGMFMEDILRVTKDSHYKTGSQGAFNGLVHQASQEGGTIYWKDSEDGKQFSKDPSWHWGSAGIISFMLHHSGGQFDIPGQQPALHK